MVTIHVFSKSAKPLATLTAPTDATLGQLKAMVAKKLAISENRVRLTIGDVALEPAEKPLSALVKGSECAVVFKDLGPQIGWKTVFLVEYAGPLFILAAFANWRLQSGRLSDFQVFACIAYAAHFIKRELETIFVHRFSNDTMPLKNIFINSGHYWGSAAIIAYFLTHPLYTAPSETQQYIGAGIFFVSEILNFYCHLKLAWLRPVGTKIRQVPRGFLFDQITCPNYTFEITAWIGYAVMTKIFAVWGFVALSTFILAKWAVGKKKRYLKEFDGLDGRDKFPKRAALFPLIF